jgi:prolyl-tRNA synthetase
MRLATYYWFSLKDTPKDAELISHQLMLRAGLIKMVASGIYIWLPMGLRILDKVINCVRTAMNAGGAHEISMPMLHPAELWQESGRWDQYGKELLRAKDRKGHDVCFGPTHEEVISALVRQDIKSYKSLPIILYQIQTKFRDEARPRAGVIRAREFLMKDAYSFHADKQSLANCYELMATIYHKIFQQLNIKYYAVEADSGAIGGAVSCEFQALARDGEDIIAVDTDNNYAANIETAAATPQTVIYPAHLPTLCQLFETPTQKTCEAVAALLKIDINNCVKSLVYQGIDNKPVLLLIRGGDTLNLIKASKLNLLQQPLTFTTEHELQLAFKCESGFLGPIGFAGTIIVDEAVAALHAVVCGANATGYHFMGVVLGRDYQATIVADIRNVQSGDIHNGSTLALLNSIEIGHIFQLGTKYSTAMSVNYLNSHNLAIPIEMGCYGIGISRLVAAYIEQHHDAKGLIWPLNLAPFHIIIVPLNYHSNTMVKATADNLYITLVQETALVRTELDKAQNHTRISMPSILLDDRDLSTGKLLADSELLGIPFRIVISAKTLAQNSVEFTTRATMQTLLIASTEILRHVKTQLDARQSSFDMNT